MREIVISKYAAQKLDTLLEYLAWEWSERVKQNFIERLDQSLSRIQQYPGSCPKSEIIEGLRLLVVTKQTSILYQFDDTTIFVAALFDNRMSPDKLITEMKLS